MHIVFLCHILQTQVYKHGIHAIERKWHVPHMISLTVMREVKKVEVRFWVWNEILQKPHESFILVWLRRIQAYFFIFIF